MWGGGANSSLNISALSLGAGGGCYTFTQPLSLLMLPSVEFNIREFNIPASGQASCCEESWGVASVTLLGAERPVGEGMSSRESRVLRGPGRAPWHVCLVEEEGLPGDPHFSAPPVSVFGGVCRAAEEQGQSVPGPAALPGEEEPLEPWPEQAEGPWLCPCSHQQPRPGQG